MTRVKITLKPTALDDLDADARRLLEAAAELADAAAQLIGTVPPAANPVVIARQHLAELKAATEAFGDAGKDVLEVRVLEPGRKPEPPVEQPKPPSSALERAGYEDGDLEQAFRANPGGQA